MGFHEADISLTKRHTSTYNLRPRHVARCNERGIGGEEAETRMTQKKSRGGVIVEPALFGVKGTGISKYAKKETPWPALRD